MSGWQLRLEVEAALHGATMIFLRMFLVAVLIIAGVCLKVSADPRSECKPAKFSSKSSERLFLKAQNQLDLGRADLALDLLRSTKSQSCFDYFSFLQISRAADDARRSTPGASTLIDEALQSGKIKTHEVASEYLKLAELRKRIDWKPEALEAYQGWVEAGGVPEQEEIEALEELSFSLRKYDRALYFLDHFRASGKEAQDRNLLHRMCIAESAGNESDAGAYRVKLRALRGLAEESEADIASRSREAPREELAPGQFSLTPSEPVSPPRSSADLPASVSALCDMTFDVNSCGHAFNVQHKCIVRDVTLRAAVEREAVRAVSGVEFAPRIARGMPAPRFEVDYPIEFQF